MRIRHVVESPFPRCCLALAATAAVAFAQGSAADLVAAPGEPAHGGRVVGLPAMVPPVVPIHTAAADLGLDYGIWGAGERYKASFHDGMTFVPYLGREYPHNQPWSWRTLSVRVGEHELVTKAPELAYEGTRAEFDLGGVVEAYDVRADGLEQTFVITALPAVGDLVVRGAVTSATTAPVTTARHAALTFCDDAGQELIAYGAATAVDAAGRRCAMTTAHERGEITLRLDAGWLGQATLPVVVDPLIQWSTYGFPTRVLDSCDVVHDAESASQPIWFAVTSYASMFDRDVSFQRADYGPLSAYTWSTVFSDITASWSAQGARCSYHAAADQAVVVFDRVTVPGLPPTRVIRAHRHPRSSYSLSTAVLDLTTTGNSFDADVGGSREQSGDTNALVVWQQAGTSSSVRGCVVDLASGAVGAAFPISAGFLQQAARPRVANHEDGAADAWLVTYEQRGTIAGSLSNVFVRQVDTTGTVTGSRRIDTSSGDNRIAPVIDGGDGRYLVAFATYPAGAPSQAAMGHEIRTARLDWDFGSSTGSEPHGTFVLRDDNVMAYRLGGLSFDGNTDSHWGLQWAEPAAYQLNFSVLGYRGAEIDTHALQMAIPTFGVQGTILSGNSSFDPSSGDFVLFDAIANNVLVSPGSQPSGLLAHRFEHASAGPWTTAGTGCSQATIGWTGPQLVGSETGAVQISGAALDSIHIVAVCAAPSAPVSLGGLGLFANGCYLLVPSAGPDFYGLLGPAIGFQVQFPLPLPEFLTSATYYFQGFHTIGGGGFDFVSTQRLAVPTVR